MATVEKKYTISASVSEVYNALTKEDLIEHWSGSPAIMDLETDGEFSLWGGSIHGINKEISQNKIVQLW
ncbi:MAG: SRPBCC domain-containing protein, partial [Bacteroidota bacterium]